MILKGSGHEKVVPHVCAVSLLVSATPSGFGSHTVEALKIVGYCTGLTAFFGATVGSIAGPAFKGFESPLYLGLKESFGAKYTDIFAPATALSGALWGAFCTYRVGIAASPFLVCAARIGKNPLSASSVSVGIVPVLAGILTYTCLSFIETVYKEERVAERSDEPQPLQQRIKQKMRWHMYGSTAVGFLALATHFWCSRY